VPSGPSPAPPRSEDSEPARLIEAILARDETDLRYRSLAMLVRCGWLQNHGLRKENMDYTDDEKNINGMLVSPAFILMSAAAEHHGPDRRPLPPIGNP
jgi:hypothetical protein